jgi:hypothetical protein
MWFNRFLVAEKNKNGRIVSVKLEARLIKLGFLHLADVLCSDLSSKRLRWYSPYEAELVTGSKVLGKALFKVIESIPVHWSYIVSNKIIEPFQLHDWCVLKSDINNGPNVSSILQVIGITADMIQAQQYPLNSRDKCSLMPAPTRLSILPKSQVIKACVLDTPEKNFVYCGNYKNSKLMLSRISWTISDLKKIPFFYFPVQSSYRAIINKIDKTISAINR